MHMLIRGLVYAENEHDALLTAKHDVFEPLVRDRTFDYYLTFDEEGRGFSGQDRWGELPVAAPASTEAGELLIEEGWEATVDRYQYHFDRLEEFFADHEQSELWEDFDAHHEYHYDFNGIGEYQGPNTFLYDQHGQGIRDRSHLENLYPLNDQNQSESTGEELYAVPADVHY